VCTWLFVVIAFSHRFYLFSFAKIVNLLDMPKEKVKECAESRNNVCSAGSGLWKIMVNLSGNNG
jgi:hypothetical protein